MPPQSLLPLLLAGGLPVLRVGAPPATTAPGILEAEWAFVRQAEREGERTAFLAALHPDGLVFRPEPTPGPAHYQAQAESPARLSWWPATSLTSAAGDLGCNTGPWEWRARPGEAPRARGWFLSVWRREPEGPWKLFWDIGLATATAPAVELRPLREAPASGHRPAPPAPLSEAQALALDRAFAARAGREGLTAAYRTRLGPEGLLFRSPEQPARGWAAAQALLAASPGDRTWTPRAALVSRSGDLLCVQGAYSRTRPGRPAETGTYVRIWRRLGPAWTLDADLESPNPPA